ncbi:hypothetical protein GCM10027184_44190 [Saccharothrix stipae]
MLAVVTACLCLAACGVDDSPDPPGGGGTPGAPAVSSVAPGPPKDLPADLALPLAGEGVTVDRGFYTEWIPATACPREADGTPRTTMESDLLRTGFLSATKVADRKQAWQLGVYADPDAAHRAFTELHAAIDRCQTGVQTARHPRDDLGADEAFAKAFYYPAGEPGDRASEYTAHVVARVDNALVAHMVGEKDTPIRDPRAPGEPTAEAVRGFVSQLCERHRWCRG